MRAFELVLALAAALACASPMGSPAEVVERGTPNTVMELESGACRDYTLIFARGTTEAGNMGGSVGPAMCDAMKVLYGTGKVACQGVGGPFKAAIADNLLSKGTTDAAIGEATRLFTLAKTKCPDTLVIASGYSQGAAVMHGSISTLPSAVKAIIQGAVMFGDSRNAQDKGQIPNYPKSQTKIFCTLLDAVCLGTQLLTPQHLLYTADISKALSFVKSMLA